jgi:hypothetical protein
MMVGWVPSLVALLYLIFLWVIEYFCTKFAVRQQERYMTTSDHRINKINEILMFIKFLKLYTWETCFKKKANEKRDKELDTLKKLAYLRSFSTICWVSSPVVILFLVVVIHSSLGGSLTAPLAFTVNYYFVD